MRVKKKRVMTLTYNINPSGFVISWNITFLRHLGKNNTRKSPRNVMERQSYKCKILYIIADSFEKRAFANGITLLK